MNILLTGSHGYVGSGIIRHMQHEHNIYGINRQIFDLRDAYATDKWFAELNDNIHFDAIIHTAIKGGSRLETDSSSILDDNIKMYLNLLNHRDRFDKFINIGSGAEIYASNSYYGLSKKIIASSISDKLNFYNLRIYGLFDEYELSTRFIKNNINRFINKENIIIHTNKYMDFIYFLDFIDIIKQYLKIHDMPKNIDCVYENKYTLIDIAKYINSLDNYSVSVEVKNSCGDTDYIGDYNSIGIHYIGLKNGIKETYRKIKNEKSMVCSQ